MRFLIFNRYLLKLFLRNGLITFCAFNGIFLLMNFTKIAARISKFGVSFLKIFHLSILLLPLSAFQTISYVLFLSLFISLGSVFKTSELVISKSIGTSYRQLMRPILIFTMIIFFLSMMFEYTFPICFKQYANLKNFYNSNNILYSMKKNTFNAFNNSTIIFRNIDNKDNINDITIVKRDKDLLTIILAKRGEIGFKNEDLILKLDKNEFFEIKEDGKNLKISENQNSEIALTDHFNFNSDGMMNKKVESPAFLSGIELRNNLKNDNYIEELHRRMIVPVQILVIGLICGIMLLKKNTPRVTSFMYDIFICLFFGYIMSFNQFMIPFLVRNQIAYLPYIHHFLIIFGFLFWMMTGSDKKRA